MNSDQLSICAIRGFGHDIHDRFGRLRTFALGAGGARVGSRPALRLDNLPSLAGRTNSGGPSSVEHLRSVFVGPGVLFLEAGEPRASHEPRRREGVYFHRLPGANYLSGNCIIGDPYVAPSAT